MSTNVDVENDTQFEDLFDIRLVPITATDTKLIRKHLGANKSQFVRGFRVENNATKKKFGTFVSKKSNQRTEMFWHGSRNENWWSIVNKGLMIRPTNAITTGAMFGHGVYFADKAQKSIGYTSLRGSYWARGSGSNGILSLYNVHLGNSLEVHNHSSSYYDMSERKLRGKGNYDSLSARAGRSLMNNEYIVYNENQTTISYIVEIS